MKGTMATQQLTHRQHPNAALAALGADARDYISRAKAARTVRAYQSDWKDFEGWCAAHALHSLPAAANTVAAYLTGRAKQSRVSTLERRVAAISQAHQLAGHKSPTREASVRTLMSGIRRAKGAKPDGKKPVLTADLRAMFAALPDGLLGVRDRALLLVGFAGGFRRSELVGLDVANLEFKREGLVVSLNRSKTEIGDRSAMR